MRQISSRADLSNFCGVTRCSFYSEAKSSRRTAAADEDVRILDLTSQPDPSLPSQDFWLFDETSVVRMYYDDQGVQLVRELLEGIDPARMPGGSAWPSRTLSPMRST